MLTWDQGNRLIILNQVFFVFWMWVIFKVFIEFVTTLLLFYVLFFCPRSMWYLSPLTRGQTHTPCFGRQSLKHWTTVDMCKNVKFTKYISTCHTLRSTAIVSVGCWIQLCFEMRKRPKCNKNLSLMLNRSRKTTEEKIIPNMALGNNGRKCNTKACICLQLL